MNYKDETVDQAINKRNKTFFSYSVEFIANIFRDRTEEVIEQTDRIIYCVRKFRLELYHSGDVTLHKGAEDFYLSEEEKTTIKNIIV